MESMLTKVVQDILQDLPKLTLIFYRSHRSINYGVMNSNTLQVQNYNIDLTNGNIIYYIRSETN